MLMNANANNSPSLNTDPAVTLILTITLALT